MSFALEGKIVVSESSDTVYHANPSFLKVLNTYSSDSVPQSLVMLGILSEQLIPMNSDREKHIRIVAESVDKAPPAKISPETVRGIMWFLSEVRDSLDSERKQIIGRLLTVSNLNSATDISKSKTCEKCNDVSNDHSFYLENSTKPQCEEIRKKDSDNATDKLDGINNELNCEFCNATHLSKKALMLHMASCEERPASVKFQCVLCQNEYTSQFALEQHLTECKNKMGVIAHRNELGNKKPTSGKNTANRGSDTYSPATKPDTRSSSKAQCIKRNAIGFVVNFNVDKGYGFIRCYNLNHDQDSSSDVFEDVFFHITDHPRRTAQEGEHLQFDILRSDEGFEAINISRKQLESEPWDRTFASKRPRWGKDS